MAKSVSPGVFLSCHRLSLFYKINTPYCLRQAGTGKLWPWATHSLFSSFYRSTATPTLLLLSVAAFAL